MTRYSNKKWAKIIGVSVFLIVCFALLFFLARNNREMRADIKAYGIETVGTITRKNTVRGAQGGAQYSVRFEFEHNRETFIRTSPRISKEQFNNIEVGDRFKVLFLPCRPRRGVLIFFDKPVENE